MAFDSKLDATKNCINHTIIIFRIKLTEQSFDFNYIRAQELINFFLPNAALIALSGTVPVRVNTGICNLHSRDTAPLF